MGERKPESANKLSNQKRRLRRRVGEVKKAERRLNHKTKDRSSEPQDQFIELLDDISVGIYRTTPDGRILMANSSLVQMLGYSSFEGLAKYDLKNDKHFEPQYPRSDFISRVERNGKVIGLKSAWKKRDGSTLFVIENARVIRDARGNTLYYEGLVQDITELKRAEDETKLLKRQLEFILGATKTGLDIIDSQFNIRFIDPEWQKTYGDPTWKKCYKYFMGRNKVCPDCGIVKALQTKNVIVSEEVLVKENNRPIQVITIPFQDEKGEWLVAEVNVDITERKRTEDALRESEERVRAILDATTESVLLMDKDATILTVNKTAAQRFGKSVEKIVGLNLKEHGSVLAPPTVIKSRLKQINEVIRSGKPVRFEDRRAGRIYDNNIYPIFNEKGQVTRLAIFSCDITEQKKNEETLRELKNRYQTLFESAPLGIGLSTKDGKIIQCNDVMLKLIGCSPSEIKQFNLADNYQNPDDRKKLLKQLQKDVFVQDLEVGLKRKDGTPYHASLTAKLIELNGQKVILAFQRDITQRKDVEDKLQQSEIKYRMLLENLPQKIFLKDRNLIYVSCNENYARQLKIKPQDIVGKTVFDFYPKEFAEKYQTDDQMVIEAGQTKDFDEKYIQDDKKGIAHVVKTPVKDERGNIVGVLGVFWDVTELRQAEAELNKYREEMVRAEQLASVGTLSASFSHELTQPLTVARLSIESVLAKLGTMSIPGTVEEKLRDCLSGVSDASSIIEKFRDYARGMYRTVVTEISLNTVAERIVKLMKGNATAAKVNLLIKNMVSLPHIHLSERDAEVLFFTLIDNAIQAADGEKEHQLTISGAVKDGYIELRFADDCGGIAPENVDKIFELFFTTKPVDKGTGLGLCIVKQIVSRVGGKVRVESNLGKGSTFFIALSIKMGGNL